MPQNDYTNRASIWKNDRKVKDTDPDFSGTFKDENGVEFWVSGWKRREGDNPKAPALKMSFRKKDTGYQQPQDPAPAPAPTGQPAAPATGAPAVGGDFDENIPF